MRILHVIPFFSPAYGGSVSVMRELVTELSKQGHEVTVITSDFRFDRKFADAVEASGTTVISFRTTANLGLFMYTPSINTWLDKNIGNFDVVHLHTFRSYQNIVVCHFARKNNVPYVIQAHGGVLPIFEKQGLKKVYDMFWGNTILKNASDNIACSKNESDQIRSMGVVKEKITVIPSCLDLSGFQDLPQKGLFKTKYGIGQDEKVILYLGRVHKIKGIDLLVDAFSELLKEMDGIRLVIAGPDGGFSEVLKKQADQLGIREKIIFTGMIDASDKQAAYVDAEVYVLPSEYEAFGLTVLEAWACGTPVILSDGCLISEFLPDKSIIFERSKDRVRVLLGHILRDNEFRVRVQNEGREFLRNKFAWSTIIHQYISCYADAMGSAGGVPPLK